MAERRRARRCHRRRHQPHPARGPELARDILHTECRLLITERAHLPLLRGPRPPRRPSLVTGTDGVRHPARARTPTPNPTPPAPRRTDRLLLYFTSGSTGAPKAAICSQGRLAAAPGARWPTSSGVRPGRRALPLHADVPRQRGDRRLGARAGGRRGGGAAAPLLGVRVPAGRTRVRGDVLHLRRPGDPVPPGHRAAHDDRDNPLRLGFGTEAGAVDAAAFERRFGVRLVEGYGSSEGGAAIQWTPGTPGRARSVGRRPAPSSCSTRRRGRSVPPARFDAAGRLLNGDEAIGELVNRAPNPFEGYWRNAEAEAERRRGGWYWTGDLFYRDADGYPVLRGPHRRPAARRQREPGRRDDREHPRRYEGAVAVAVYAVPDPVTGDQVMATLAGTFDPETFVTSWRPSPIWGRRWRPGSCGWWSGCRSPPRTRSTGRGSGKRACGARTRCGGGRRGRGRTGDWKTSKGPSLPREALHRCAARDSNPGPADAAPSGG